MTDLHKQLKQFMAFYLPPGGNVDQAVADVEKAFIDAGWLPIEPVINKYLDAGGDQKYYVVSQEYYDKNAKKESLSWALHAIHDHMDKNDYFRDDKHFKSSTVTMAELEKVLQKAAGIE